MAGLLKTFSQKGAQKEFDDILRSQGEHIFMGYLFFATVFDLHLIFLESICFRRYPARDLRGAMTFGFRLLRKIDRVVLSSYQSYSSLLIIFLTQLSRILYLRWTHLYWLQSVGESKTPVGWNKYILKIVTKNKVG